MLCEKDQKTRLKYGQRPFTNPAHNSVVELIVMISLHNCKHHNWDLIIKSFPCVYPGEYQLAKVYPVSA